MPLGVDEFLANVHFEHKDEPLNADAIPLEQISETAYLVTNTNIGAYIILSHISIVFIEMYDFSINATMLQFQ